jgi:zinc protease
MNQTEEFRRQQPAPLPPRPLNIPTPYETVLPNGLRLVIVEDKRLPLVSYRLAFRTGDANDPKDLPGLTEMMTAMLTEGTESRNSRQIADATARIGATLAAGANADYTTVAASALAIYGDEVLGLMADVVLHPSFPEDELDLSRQNTKEGLKQQRAQPSFLASEMLSRIIFGEHPYSIISPTPESIDAMTREKLVQFHLQTFVPANAVFIVVGAVEREQVINRMMELFGAWTAGEPPASDFPSPPARVERTIYLVDRQGSAQSNIVIANLGLTRTNPDYFPLLLMHTVLGANASSRLFMNLREEKGYTYGAYSSLDARRTAGTLRATAEVRTPVTGASLKEFFYELNRIRDEVVSEKEIGDAKAYLTGVFPIRLETQEGLIDQLVQIKMYGLPGDYLQHYRERVSAVTAEDIQRAAKQYITTESAAIVIVGDAAAVMDQIEPYSQNIELYDTNGKPKELSTLKERIEAGGAINVENAAHLLGTWKLEIATPLGQTLQATLIFKHEGQSVGGLLQSPMGEAPLSNLSLDGQNFNATLALDDEDQNISASVNGSVVDDEISGSLNLPGTPSLTFTGTKEKPEVRG